MAEPKIINAIVRGSDVLQCLSEGINRIADISQKLQLSKSTTHRLLKTLERTGLAVQDPLSRRYCLGPRILKLASNPIIAHQNLIICAIEEMERLRDLTGETVGLQIPYGKTRIILEEILSPQQIKFFGGKGFSGCIYTGAAGKVLLSEFKENEFKRLLDNIELLPVGPNTITDKKTLIEEMNTIRRQGFATSLSESTPGGAAIAVPVKNYVCPVALGVIGPESRFLEIRMSFLPQLLKSAKSISTKLKGLSKS